MKKTNIGGQAVIEGVMMRGKKIYAMAVRNPEGEIVLETKEVGVLQHKKLFRLPIFRGMAAFVDSLITGTKIMMRSAEIAGEDWADEELSKTEQWIVDKLGDKVNDILIYISVALSMVLGVGLFMLLPVWLGSFFKTFIPVWALGVVEGLLRIVIFLVYLFLISRMKDIQRVFQYHGAEHKTISCFESGKELTVENVLPCTRLHKRCGTSFLLFVMVISMIVFFFVQTDSIWMRFASRIVLVPFVAGISYEVIRWAGNSESKIVEWISKPGLCLQKITTAEPDGAQIETAIAAMKGVLAVEPEENESEGIESDETKSEE
ncbi:DUF1385 domain-containing protein [Chakrabartyella piscis]|uniref:DUF1385 domain-containing protein n=1 Tax=Chakrabartyella piscis TaxID=2918914 RepID=UPI002958ACB9|nr:DUF1385 domain-containing protein [Chakrabartyella piscis]